MSRAFTKERDDELPELRPQRKPPPDLPKPPKSKDVVGFGATVVVVTAPGEQQTFTIVGEDNADVHKGRISYTSPLGQALMGAKAGSVVVWHRPAGDRDVTVKSVAYKK